MLLLAGGLIGLSIPQFLAAVELLPGNPVVARLRQGKPVSPADMETAVIGRLRSLTRRPAADVYAEVGLIRLNQALAAGPATEAGRRYLADSLAASRVALSLAPSAPYVWMTLAHGTLLHDGPGRATGPWAMSVRTGPLVRDLLLPRLEIGFVLWRSFDHAEREAFDGQVRAAAKMDPAALAVAAGKLHALLAVREALQGDPALLDRFDKAYVAALPRS